MKRLFFSMLALLALSTQSQTIVTGRILNHFTAEPVANASVKLNVGESGAISSSDGAFSLTLEAGTYIIIISHIAYNTKSIPFRTTPGEKIDLGIILLEEKTIGLEEVSIIASLATERETPVAVTNIPSQTIEQRIGNQEFPEIMKRSPGLYATKTGGGTGDARLSIRGFQQENIALLLNGVPVSSVENGLVYWSNWAGLADATQSIQVQRGLGASKVAVNSVGGTINIITKGTEAEKAVH
jgi:iron complex outermembrane recepter protein